jgi:hypothetical protein
MVSVPHKNSDLFGVGTAPPETLPIYIDGETERGGDLPTEDSLWPKGKLQVPPLRYPNFLSSLVALANFMRLSLRKVAHVTLDGAAK